MVRPCKCRRVGAKPRAECFKPAGVPARHLEEVILTMDEFEALRLADFDGLYQEDGAKEMNISRQTFGNILTAAHRKIANCLVNGKTIRIEGGAYDMEVVREFRCTDCINEWKVNYGDDRPTQCPQCGSTNIHRAPQDRGYAGTAAGGGPGRCRRWAR